MVFMVPSEMDSLHLLVPILEVVLDASVLSGSPRGSLAGRLLMPQMAHVPFFKSVPPGSTDSAVVQHKCSSRQGERNKSRMPNLGL